MKKLDLARQEIHALVNQAASPAVCCSFGKDAMLVLALAREARPDIPVIWLRQHVTKEQVAFAEQVIMDWDLTVLGFGVNHWTIVEREGGYSVVYAYNVNGEDFGIVHDVVEGEKCLLTMRPTFSAPVTLPHDCLLMGWKDADTHELKDTPYATDGMMLGNTALSSPLRDWTDAEVGEATHLLGIPFNQQKYVMKLDTADPDNVIASTRCLQEGVCRCLDSKS